jgi:hypothetical protein
MEVKPEQNGSLERSEGRRKVQGGEMVVCLRAIDAAEADTFRMGVVQDFDRVAVEDGDNGAGEVGGVSRGRP